MNLLAHLHLGGGLPAGAASGNLLADFLRRYGPAPADPHFAAGLCWHRRADAFAAAHPVYRATRRLLAARRRRVGGILADLAYDYCLTQAWRQYSPVPLAVFIAEQLAGIRKYLEGFDTPLRQAAAAAADGGWLARYGTVDGLRLTLQRIAPRTRAGSLLAGAEADILEHREVIAGHFARFYPELLLARDTGRPAPPGMALDQKRTSNAAGSPAGGSGSRSLPCTRC